MQCPRWFFQLFHRCLKSPESFYLWEENALRCPICHALIAYRYYLHGKWQVHVTAPYLRFSSAIAHTGILSAPTPCGISLEATIAALHTRDPAYDEIICVSDDWQD